MSKKQKIVIVEPSPILSTGISYLLSNNLQYDVIAIIDTFEKLQERIRITNPDILIINPLVIDFSKRYMIKSLFQSYSDLILIALVSSFVEQAVLKQFHTVIEITDTQQKIESKLRESVVSTNSSDLRDNYELSEREIDVLIAVAKGKMNKEIADDLHISIHTVITHRKNISRKTGIKSVSGLTVYALLNNLIDESSVQ